MSRHSAFSKRKRPGREKTRPSHAEKVEGYRRQNEEAERYWERLTGYPHLQPDATCSIPEWDREPPFDVDDEITAEYMTVIGRAEQ